MAGAGVLRGPGEVAEDEATGDVADAYARLRAALGVGFLPTVVRMLGGYDRLLVAVTDAVAGVIGGPQGEAFAADARRRGQVAARRLPGGGLDAGEATGDVRALLDRYNVANPRNLLLVLALGGTGDGTGPAESGPAVMRDPLPAPAADLLGDVRACHGGFTVPGMWRELIAGWPDVAADAWRLVRPLAAEDALHAAAGELVERGRELVGRLAVPDAAALGYDADDQAAIAGMLAWFRLGIPTMVVEIEYVRDRLRDA